MNFRSNQSHHVSKSPVECVLGTTSEVLCAVHVRTAALMKGT